MAALLFLPSAVAADYSAECLSVSAPSLVYHGQTFVVNATFNNTGTKDLFEDKYYLYNGASTLFTWSDNNYYYPNQDLDSGSQASFLISMYSRGTVPGAKNLLVSLKRTWYSTLLATCDASLQVVGFVNATANTFSAQPSAQLSGTNPERYTYTLALPFYNNGYSPWQQGKFAVYINASEPIFLYPSGEYLNSINLGMNSGDNVGTWSTKTFSLAVYPSARTSAYRLKISARMRNLTDTALFGSQGDFSIAIPAATPVAPQLFSLSGQVVNPLASGSPGVPGAYALWYNDTAHGYAVADGNGYFNFSLPSGRYVLNASGPSDYATGNTRTVDLTQNASVVLFLNKSVVAPVSYFSLSGQVVNPLASGSPGVPGAYALWYNDTAHGYAVADGNGYFNFSLPSGRYVLNASGPSDYATGNTRTVDLTQNASVVLFLNKSVVASSAYYWVNGTVVDPSVSETTPYPAVPNASVYVRNETVSYFVFANSAGRFGLYLRPGSYVLNANATGYYTGNYVDVAVSTQNVSITLFANHSSSAHTGSIYGKVADYYSNATIDAVNVTLFLQSNDPGVLRYLSHSLTTSGYYSFNELAGGNYSLAATHPSYYSADTAVSVLLSQVSADFSLKPLPYIYGFVTDSDGKGIADALANATPTNSNAGPAVTATNSSGGYRFDSLSSSNYTILVSKAGYASKSISNVAAPTSEGVRADFVLVANTTAISTPAPTVAATVTPTPTAATSTPVPTESVPFSQSQCPDFSANQSLYSECIKSFGEYIMLKDANGCTYNAICKPNATSASIPSPTPNGVYTFPLSASTAQELPAEIFGINYSTSPVVINMSRVTNLSGIVNTSKSVMNFSCSGPTDCVCLQKKIYVGGKWQDLEFVPDAVGDSGYYRYNISCNFSTPVNGNYSIFAYDLAQEIPTNTIGIMLTPGQLPVVYIVAPQAGSASILVVAASVVIALGMLAFAAFALFDFMFRDARKVSALEAQKAQIVEDIKMVKYRFMKRQIDEATFRKTMAEKEKEYTLVVSQLKTLKKDLKEAEQ